MKRHPEETLKTDILKALAASEGGEPMTQRELRDVLTIEAAEDSTLVRMLSLLVNGGFILAVAGRYRLTPKGAEIVSGPVPTPATPAPAKPSATSTPRTPRKAPPPTKATPNRMHVDLQRVIEANLENTRRGPVSVPPVAIDEPPVATAAPPATPPVDAGEASARPCSGALSGAAAEPRQEDLRWVSPPTVLGSASPVEESVTPPLSPRGRGDNDAVTSVAAGRVAALRALLCEVDRSLRVDTPDDVLHAAYAALARLRDRVTELEHEVGVLSLTATGVGAPRWVRVGVPGESRGDRHALMVTQTVQAGWVALQGDEIVWSAGTRSGTINDTDPFQNDAGRIAIGQAMVRSMLGLS